LPPGVGAGDDDGGPLDGVEAAAVTGVSHRTDRERSLVDLARRSGLDARPLADFHIDAPTTGGLVVGYGHQRADALEHAVQDLATQLATQRQV
jgi:DNA-binding transcriptional MocR family regulator